MKFELFKFDDAELRLIVDGDSIWFCATDLTKALGYKDSGKAICLHCKAKGTVKRRTLTSKGEQELTYLDESNMYRLVMGSKQKGAERFQDWVVNEVLPAIRKTGGYNIQKQITPAQMFLQQAQAMVQFENQLVEVKTEVAELRAKITTHPNDYFAIAGYASLLGIPIDVTTAASLGRKASIMCKNLGYQTHSMPDPRFGSVKLYPVEVLKTLFPKKI